MAVAGYGEFAGKVAFGSTAEGPAYYLTTGTFKDAGDALRLPTMSATSVTAGERCILYAATGGGVRMQLGSLLWVKLEPSVGWLVLTDDFDQASELTLGGSPPGRTLEIATSDGPATVYYTVGTASPILTINEAPGALSEFAPVAVTPSLEQMRAAGGSGANLRQVDLTEADLGGIDFTDADFTEARLVGATCSRTTFTGAVARQAVLTGFTADGAVLDRMDCTGALLEGVAWGEPKSAAGIVLASCRASKAVLGSTASELDCSGANLTGGDFRGADLTRLKLSSANLGGAILVGAVLDKVVLDDADLRDALLLGARIRGASMKRIGAQGANLVAADLSGSDLNQARMGAKAFLFDLSAGFADELDRYGYPQENLIEAFGANGVTLSGSAPVVVLAEGSRWAIEDDANGPFALNLAPPGSIAVFLDSPALTPATLAGARCVGTLAAGAALAGADLRGVRWYAAPATLDHADLEGAYLSGSLLVNTDFTQAFLSGADLSGAVLVGASLAGTRIGTGASRQATSFGGAQVQGVDFTQSTLLGVSLDAAAVATASGVPLLRLPASDEPKLTTARISELAPVFAAAGFPLGSEPVVRETSEWVLDNAADPNSSSPRSYLVVPASGKLAVKDGGDGRFLFYLNDSYRAFLDRPTAGKQLRAGFTQNGYSLVDGAPIDGAHYWAVEAGADQPLAGPTNYPTMRVEAAAEHLQVYGATLLRLRDWDDYPQGIAFGGTRDLRRALSPSAIGPSGYPYSSVTAARIDWLTYLSARRERSGSG